MTLPASGAISLYNVNQEIGNGVNAISLAWVRDNTYYGYKDLNSIHGKTWFTAVSSNGGITRTEASTATNCATNCAGQYNTQAHGSQTNCGSLPNYSHRYTGYAIPSTNCALIANVNCNQCGTSHGTHLQGNCNCACNCYVCNCQYTNCNCNCDCNCENCNCGSTTCFPAGSLVLMADGTERAVETLKVGELLMCATGKPVAVTRLYSPILGSRRMLSNGDLLFSEEHPFWMKQDGEEGLACANVDILSKEIEDGIMRGFTDSAARYSPQLSGEFAHLSGWVNREVVEVPADSNTQLYVPMTGGELIIVNGYVVTSDVDEATFKVRNGIAYNEFKWSGL